LSERVTKRTLTSKKKRIKRKVKEEENPNLLEFSYQILKLASKEFSMLDFTITPRQFHLLVAPLLSFLPQAVIWHRSDYRAHKFKTQPHLLLTIFAHLTKAESANALVEELNDFSQPS